MQIVTTIGFDIAKSVFQVSAMTAILQLTRAKRTFLLGKISSNLRPLTLHRRRARQ